MTDREYTDYASVRDALLMHKTAVDFCRTSRSWLYNTPNVAASDQRNGHKTDSKVYRALFSDLQEIEKLAEHADICAKIAEMMPLSAEEVRSILASKRIPMDGGEVDNIVDTVRKQIL